jgi:hypothetical protein
MQHDILLNIVFLHVSHATGESYTCVMGANATGTREAFGHILFHFVVSVLELKI